MTAPPRIRLDYSWMMADNIGPAGLRREQVDEAAGRAAEAMGALWEGRPGEAPRRGLAALPFADDVVACIEDFTANMSLPATDVLLLGIGGSALGPRAIAALCQARGPLARRLWVLDNVDPTRVHATLALLDASRTLVVVVSKSGATLETLSLYLVVRSWLERATGAEARRRTLVVTDPDRGLLRELARDEGLAAFDIPPDVGGRFSVLSPVGLLPAALCGCDVRALVDGARETVLAFEHAGAAHPAAVAAALHVLMDLDAGRPVSVLMPYGDALSTAAEWFLQLWAESLGKLRDGRPVGPTPVRAVGATDQHSQLQLYMQGPHDKHVWFVDVEQWPHAVRVPAALPGRAAVAHLPGHDLVGILRAERRATAAALARAGRPNATWLWPSLDEASLGAFFMTCELMTVGAAALYGVDPYGQPGVEAGKRFAHALLGNPQFAEARAHLEALESQRTPFVA